MKYHLYKDTLNKVWNRTYYVVESESEKDALNKILDDEVDLTDSEILFETFEELNPEDNDFKSTVEIFNEDNDLIYRNSSMS